jgi:hypothetical protein
MKFAGVEITQDSIMATREHFAANAQACIDEAVSGAVKVNDLPNYIEWRKEQIADALAGKDDHTFTFVQCAHWIQTGECIGLFSN